MCLIMKTCNFLRDKQSQWLKPYVELNKQKRIEAEKNGEKDGKGLLKLINSSIYVKTVETLRNRIDVKLFSNEKYCWKWKSKPSYKSLKMFDNDLIAICKSRVTVRFN